DSGGVRLLMDAMPGTQLAFAPDGHHLAFLGSEIGPPSPNRTSSSYGASVDSAQSPLGLSVVWLVDTETASHAPATGWRAPLEAGEQLVDVSWTPSADRLLAIASKSLEGGARRSRAWLVDADSQLATPILSLPSDVSPGTEAWSPDGSHVTFVAHAGQVNA